MTAETAEPLPFAKGHGTENDFVILPDPEGRLDVSPALVRKLCDRRAGIGGDGLLRVVRTAHAAEALGLDGEWFMDYRNADGSIAEMCGNGIRVFARYLVSAGLAEPGLLPIATRAGTKAVTVPADGGEITVDMGPVLLSPLPWGAEATVDVGDVRFTGVSASVGNPHLVCGTAVPVDEIDLSRAPVFDPRTFPHGVNVEIVNVLATAPEGFAQHVKMRVYERGVGETRSCGTGACAVGAVALELAGRSAGRVAVDVPGGRVSVTVTAATTLLTGPAVLVGAGELAPGWPAGSAPVRRVAAAGLPA